MDYLVSVIVPVHNTADYLPKCVESIQKQSLKAIEIILVENNSTDNSAALCDRYAASDERIKVLHLEEANASKARNSGLAVASAACIGFVDSDDYIEPTMYEELWNAMRQYGVDIAYANFQTEYLDGKIVCGEQNTGKVLVRTSMDVLRDMMVDKLNCSSCTKLYKRSVFSSRLFPEDNLYEDRIVMHHWVLKAGNLAWIDRTFYHYVERSSSTCHTVTPLNRYHYFKAEFSRIRFLDEQPVFTGYELQEARNRLIRICFFTFCEYVNLVKPACFQKQISEMRGMLKQLLKYPPAEMERMYRKRIKRIVYWWPFYYWRHFT